MNKEKITDSMKSGGTIASVNGSITFRTETKNRTVELSKAYDKLIEKNKIIEIIKKP